MSAECGRSRRTKRGSCFRAANRERQPSKKRTHTTRHGYASPKPRKSLSEATVTRLAVQSNTNLLHRARKLVVCIIVQHFLAAQLQYSTFAQHHFLAFPWHCKTTICISISHSHCCLLQIGPSMCQIGKNNHDQKHQTRPTGCPRVMPRKWYDEYFAWPNTCTRMARNACYVFTAIENGDLSFGTSSFEPCVFFYKIRKKGG